MNDLNKSHEEPNHKAYLIEIQRRTKCEWTRGYIEATLDAGRPPGAQRVTQIIQEAGPNAKIQAIKGIRTEFGLTLRDAKHLIDEYYIHGRIIFPSR